MTYIMPVRLTTIIIVLFQCFQLFLFSYFSNLIKLKAKRSLQHPLLTVTGFAKTVSNHTRTEIHFIAEHQTYACILLHYLGTQTLDHR